MEPLPGSVCSAPIRFFQEEPKCGPVCAIFCEFGNVLDEQGCPTCKCINPCDNHDCKEGTMCQPEAKECLAEPCPQYTCVAREEPECGPVCDIYCEFGNVADEKGCPTCQCINPCDEHDCKEGTQCQPEAKKCLTEPCPQYTCVAEEEPSTAEPKTDSKCPKAEPCNIRCAYGLKYDADGCQLCECVDPCAEHDCKETDICVAQRRMCITSPCPQYACVPREEAPPSSVSSSTAEPKTDGKCPKAAEPCNLRCAYGLKYDAEGCQLCECVDLCAEHVCKEGTQCQPEPKQCLTEPCPQYTCVPREEPVCGPVCAIF